MRMETFKDGEIDGVLVRPPEKDARGWLCELFRRDEAEEKHWPAMCSASMTSPGVTRGRTSTWTKPIGFASSADSPTSRNRVTLEFGQSAPASLIVPAGVVNGSYRNVGTVDGQAIVRREVGAVGGNQERGGYVGRVRAGQ